MRVTFLIRFEARGEQCSRWWNNHKAPPLYLSTCSAFASPSKQGTENSQPLIRTRVASSTVSNDRVGVGVDESVVSMELNKFAWDDRSHFPGKDLASPPPDFWEGVFFSCLQGLSQKSWA